MKRIECFALLAVLAGFNMSCTDKEGEARLAKLKARTDLEARNIELVKNLLAEIDKGNMEVFGTALAPDFKYFFPSNSPKPMSREDEQGMARMFFKAMPDMKHEVTDIFAVEDKVVLRYVVRGTHQAELEGFPPTGKPLAITAISILRIRDGQVVEEAEEADMLGFYQQLGMELKPKKSPK